MKKVQQTTSKQDASRRSIDAYMQEQSALDLLRFITCGSVDDGKSTLIGRMLYESKMIFDDQIVTLERDSKKQGTQQGSIDFALLVDGLAAEREQGITIDVAYRFFNTSKRKFIVADTPGHEQYTRNMATGASTADLAILLIDARQGVLPQTRRHSYIISLFGIKHVVLAINKIDLVDYAQPVFQSIVEDYLNFAAPLAFEDITPIPLSALHGDNIIIHSSKTNWYQGATLLGHLENIPIQPQHDNEQFIFPVQWVTRPHADFRGFAGTVASGNLRVGSEVLVQPSGEQAIVQEIVLFKSKLECAHVGQAVTIVLDREVDVSRGDVLVSSQHPVVLSDRIYAHVVWMNKDMGTIGNAYLLKLGCTVISARMETIFSKKDVNTLQNYATDRLVLNDIASVEIVLDREIPVVAYQENHTLGAFILVDRLSNQTMAAGMVTDTQKSKLGHGTSQHDGVSVDFASQSLACLQSKVFCFAGDSARQATLALEIVDLLLKQNMPVVCFTPENIPCFLETMFKSDALGRKPIDILLEFACWLSQANMTVIIAGWGVSRENMLSVMTDNVYTVCSKSTSHTVEQFEGEKVILYASDQSPQSVLAELL